MKDDTISRQAAINVLEERLQANGYSSVVLVSELNRSIGYLKQLPSAERHGRWKETTTLNLLECSVCGQMIYSESVLDRKAFHKWCGRCGAKMDEVSKDG